MPGVYMPQEIDVVGTIIGVVDHTRIIDGSRIQPGDVILGLPSSGLHTNGFTLARTALETVNWHEPHPELEGKTPGEALLAVHRPYLQQVNELRTAGIDIRGLAHITGGGLIDNPPRILPEGVGAKIRWGTWPVPPIFRLIQHLGGISDAEMCHVFNMGLGMLVIVSIDQVKKAHEMLSGEVYIVGEIVGGKVGVNIV
jgi:phosphoribosylformylglycinamidine cyclo-ligase